MSDHSFTAFHSSNPNTTLSSLAVPKITTIPSLAQPYCSICTHCNHLLTFNHHTGDVGEEGRGNGGMHYVPSSSSSSSSRWSPTPIQLLVLEELYRQGTKTPSAEQIQQIASQLRQFGKIEGKNVFYWFQNHKARDRQKRRRREMEMMEETGASSPQGLKETAGCEVKETKKWASTSNCSGHAEESTPLDISEKGSNGRTKFEERSIQVLMRRSMAADQMQAKNRHQNMEMAHFFPPTAMTSPTSVASHRTPFSLNRESFIGHDNHGGDEEEENNGDPRTLDLFPVKRDGQGGICISKRKPKLCAGASMEEISCCSNNEFFEFLPLRN